MRAEFFGKAWIIPLNKMVRNIAKLEGLAVLVASLFLYSILEGNWIMFGILLLTPDISMLGYLHNKITGSITYNLVHNYIFAFVLCGIGVFSEQLLLTQIGVILFAHVGIDRFFGFGLKYPENFKSTHIQKL